jgi:predicted RNase H-like HicB family nuclease
MIQFLIIIEKANGNYSSFSPDIPGCIATGKTAQEAKRKIREAIEFHIEGLVKEGLPVPKPSSKSDYVSLEIS